MHFLAAYTNLRITVEGCVNACINCTDDILYMANPFTVSLRILFETNLLMYIYELYLEYLLCHSIKRFFLFLYVVASLSQYTYVCHPVHPGQ